MTHTQREDWGFALAAADSAAVAALAKRITARVKVEAIAPPREGLMLLQMRDSVAGSPFHPGEIPVARVHLRLVDGVHIAEGGAVLMTDDLARVTQIAVLDAAMAAGLDEAPEIEALIVAGHAARARAEAERALVLERTRVDFQLLSEEDT